MQLVSSEYNCGPESTQKIMCNTLPMTQIQRMMGARGLFSQPQRLLQSLPRLYNRFWGENRDIRPFLNFGNLRKAKGALLWMHNQTCGLLSPFQHLESPLSGPTRHCSQCLTISQGLYQQERESLLLPSETVIPTFCNNSFSTMFRRDSLIIDLFRGHKPHHDLRIVLHSANLPCSNILHCQKDTVDPL